jgi:hypothetical protein
MPQQWKNAPNLLLEIATPDQQQLIKLLAEGQVRLAYQSKWCCFRYQILEDESKANHQTLSIAIELNNAFLHHGQFKTHQVLQLYHSGQLVAMGIVKQVITPELLFWDDNELLAAHAPKKPFPAEYINAVFSEWKARLVARHIHMEYNLSQSGHDILVQLNSKLKTITLQLAQQFCQTVTVPNMTCYYKVNYTPVAYGLVDLFLEDFSLSFFLTNDRYYAKGQMVFQ